MQLMVVGKSQALFMKCSEVAEDQQRGSEGGCKEEAKTVSIQDLLPHEHTAHLDHVLHSPGRLHETAVKGDTLAFA